MTCFAADNAETLVNRIQGKDICMNKFRLMEFQDSLEEMGIAGNDLALYVDGQEVYRYIRGMSHIETNIPLSEKTLYRMYSMTKPITCAAAMKLYEEGRFLMNDPVCEYLPEFKDITVARQTSRGMEIMPAQQTLLIRHLFNMTSGIDYDMEHPVIAEALKKYGDEITTRQLAEAIARKPLLFEPGTHWMYGLNHDVLGALIETISAKSFYAYLKEAIFDPLEMHDTWFREPAERTKDVCGRYGKNAEGMWTAYSSENVLQPGKRFESGGAGLTMTVSDYARFACAMSRNGLGINGERILAGRTIDLMRSNTLSDALLVDMWQTPTRVGYGYGYGVRTLVDASLSGSPSSTGEFGWGGAWGSYTLMDPDNKVTIVYAEQAYDTKGPYIQRRLRNMAYSYLEWEGFI